MTPSGTIASVVKRNQSTLALPPREHTSMTITAREQEVLHLIAYEHSSKEIAAKLNVSHETINSHRKNMMEKLGVRNTAGLVRVACERDLISTTTT